MRSTPDEQSRFDDDVLAVKAALRDLENGERGIPFDEHLRELSEQFGLNPSDQRE